MLGHSFYVAASRLKDELLIVVTNKNPKKAISIYNIRWEIEILFACLKTLGFCLEDTYLTPPERIDRLIFTLSIAFC
nr:transposase [Neochlamydia sp. AcF84]